MIFESMYMYATFINVYAGGVCAAEVQKEPLGEWLPAKFPVSAEPVRRYERLSPLNRWSALKTVWTVTYTRSTT